MRYPGNKTNVDEAAPAPATAGQEQTSPFRPAKQAPLLTRAMPVTVSCRATAPRARDGTPWPA